MFKGVKMPTVLTSREANEDFSRVGRAAENGPVIITDRGRPTRALLTYDAYRKLLGVRASVLDALAMPDSDAVDFEIPPRSKVLPRDIDLE